MKKSSGLQTNCSLKITKDNIKEHPMDKITFGLLSRNLFKPEEFEHITPISVLIKKRQLALMGHLIRMDVIEPEREVIADASLRRKAAGHKRLYGPRDHWWDDNLYLAYEIMKENPSLKKSQDAEESHTNITIRK